MIPEFLCYFHFNLAELNSIWLCFKSKPLPYENKKNLNEITGANIKAWREVKGVKQEWLAAKIGVCKSSLSQIESGKTEITISRLSKIADVLEISLFHLFENPLDQIKKNSLLPEA